MMNNFPYPYYHPYYYPPYAPDPWLHYPRPVTSVLGQNQKNSQNSSPSLQIKEQALILQQAPQIQAVQSVKVEDEIILRKQSQLQPPKRKIKKIERDDSQFHRRYQDQHRNLTSITLKMYLKWVKMPNTNLAIYIQQLIQNQHLDITIQRFRVVLNSLLPSKRSYISLNYMKEIAEGDKIDVDFGRVVRSSMMYFFQKQIYTALKPSLKKCLKLRLEQMRKARTILNEIKNW